MRSPWAHQARACIRLTYFRSAARGLHVPPKLTPEPTKHAARKRWANERPRVGCCEELARGPQSDHHSRLPAARIRRVSCRFKTIRVSTKSSAHSSANDRTFKTATH